MAAREVIFEHIQQGAIVRVAAVDVLTGVEVVIQGPISAARHDLERVAYQKLLRRLGLAGEGGDKPPPDGKGWVV